MKSANLAATFSLSDKWLKAAIIGSVWAAFEIIAGSFLHNLRVPFAGTSLAAASVFLLISFMQLWREPGIIIRAGIICALMKSISPSAIILGPMLGIFMEALIVEIVVWLLGRNLAAYIIAGGLAVIWTLLQKLLNLLVLYGFDLVKIAAAFYQFLAQQLSFISSSPNTLIVIIFSLYGLLGALAALAGFIIGRRHQRSDGKPAQEVDKSEHKQNAYYGVDPSQPYSFINLFLVIAAVVANLYFLNRGWTIIALFSGLAFMIFCAFRYKRSLRHLKKPAIWIQFLIITVIAALFWEWLNTGEYFSERGLRAGLEMNYRALVIIFGFSAVSVELRNPLIKMLLFRRGFSQVYYALNLAFGALPAMIESLPRPRHIVNRPGSLIHQLLSQAEQLYARHTGKSDGSNVFIITGEVHEGKTTYVENLITLLKAKNLEVLGFVSKGSFFDGKRQAYELLNLSTAEAVPLASAEQQEGWVKFRRFWFNPQAIALGNNILGRVGNQEKTILVVDEIGPMELEGLGWHPSLLKISTFGQLKQIWVIRRGLVVSVKQKYNLENAVSIDINTSDINLVAEMIKGVKPQPQ